MNVSQSTKTHNAITATANSTDDSLEYCRKETEYCVTKIMITVTNSFKMYQPGILGHLAIVTCYLNSSPSMFVHKTLIFSDYR